MGELYQTPFRGSIEAVTLLFIWYLSGGLPLTVVGSHAKLYLY
ncbi:hypothetical protein DMTZ50_1454 [Dehalococcoides mccartyi]|uniref:Uncharacterized protein n=1 Tax=Dehalococcoides mccartyi TaxID=61435 RepID=A0A142VB69_9CHLR|nr:hypothetical protein Dm11a5_1232 [Dehalococcoides mccartyi]AOV99845.1 hypothetical protein DCWBC2_1223 [Dehalococcoides mccartyi]MBA2085625.1 hypothetical protein [Dehalococcoides mccartyi]